MKVFLTGGTGAIGRYVVPELVSSGHDVVALARAAEKGSWLAERGATPAVVSMFDADALTRAMDGCDAVANLATAIPPTAKAMKASAWEPNTRIRTEGSAAIVDAALAANVGRLVQESIVFPYPDRGDEWIDESVPFDAGSPILGAVGVAEENAGRFTAAGRIGVVLRFAQFYGPGSFHSEDALRAARRHVGPTLGTGDGYQSSIHLVDAATAVVAALSAPAGIYNVGDDEPLLRRDWAAAVSAAAATRPWVHLPGKLVKLGGAKAEYLTRSQRVSNAAFKAATGWSPRYPSAREGWAAYDETSVDA